MHGKRRRLASSKHDLHHTRVSAGAEDASGMNIGKELHRIHHALPSVILQGRPQFPERFGLFISHPVFVVAQKSVDASVVTH
jgi:hypothetical protein